MQPDDAEHRGDGGKMIIGDDRLGLADHRDKGGGLAHVGVADQADVGQQLELQLQVEAFARKARLAKRGVCLVAVAKWMLPQPPLPPRATSWGASSETSARMRPVSASHQGAAGHMDDQVRGAPARTAGAPAVLAVLCGVFALVAEVGQGGKIVVGDEEDVASPAAVPPSDPPEATYFSLRKETAPSLPLPA